MIKVTIELPDGSLKKKEELKKIYQSTIKNISKTMKIRIYDIAVKFIERDLNYTYLMNTKSKAPSSM